MNIAYLSPAYEAMFAEMIRDHGDLSELFGCLVLQLQANSDFEDLMISFEDEGIMRIRVEESPFVMVLDEESRVVSLIVLDEDGEQVTSEDHDFDDDGIETVVDIMVSRVLDGEDDWYYEMARYGV